MYTNNIYDYFLYLSNKMSIDTTISNTTSNISSSFDNNNKLLNIKDGTIIEEIIYNWLKLSDIANLDNSLTNNNYRKIFLYRFNI